MCQRLSLTLVRLIKSTQKRTLTTEASVPHRATTENTGDSFNASVLVKEKPLTKLHSCISNSPADKNERPKMPDLFGDLRDNELVGVCVDALKKNKFEVFWEPTIKFIVNVVTTFTKSPRTCFLAAAIARKCFGLAQIDARVILYLASKFEDVEPLTLEDIQTFSTLPELVSPVIEEEKKVLDYLNYEMVFSTPVDFYGVLLQRVDAYVMSSSSFKFRCELVKQIADRGMAYLLVGLYSYNMLKYTSSLQAVGALCAATVELFRWGEFADNIIIAEIFELLFNLEDCEAAVVQCSFDLLQAKSLLVYGPT